MQNKPSWSERLRFWEERSQEKEKEHPLKVLKSLPNMPGVCSQDAKFLKTKGFFYLLRHDQKKLFKRYFLRSPFKFGKRLIEYAIRRPPLKTDGDFYLYGYSSVDEFEKEIPTLEVPLVLGFSYCHKPHECPSGRFSQKCERNPEHPVCGQCLIGKFLTLSEDNIIPIVIPTVHHIGDKMLKIVNRHRGKKVRFLITACEMSLKMFIPFAHMLGIKGIGVRLDGRICNTMKAFKLAEEGIKPGLTVVLPETEQRILNLLKLIDIR